MTPDYLHHLSDALRDYAPAIANHLWQSTALAGVVWMLTLPMRKNSAQVRFGLWLAASIKFLLPFSLLIALGGMLPRPHHVVVTMPIYSAVDNAGLPFDEAIVSAGAPTRMAATAQDATRVPNLPLVLLALWLCGAMAVLLRWTASWDRVARVRRSAVFVGDGREAAILSRLEREIAGSRTSRPIPLLLSAGSMEPGVFGVFRPVLLWPKQLSEQLDDEQIELILAHELMHVRRHDNLTAALHMLVQAAFWFHPAVWWMGRQMVAERELACDEAVVEIGNRRGVYAEGLLKTVRFCVESPLACASGVTGADLKKRVHAIMRGRLERLGWARKAALAALAVIVIAAPLAFGMLRMIPLYGQVFHAAGPLPSYEVVVIKPTQEAAHGGGTEGEQTRYLVTAKMLIEFAYAVYAPPKLLDLKVVGGPDWINTEVFDILGKMDAAEFQRERTMNRGAKHERRQMMDQSVLADRFHLKMHTEMQDQPVYALTVVKPGKLTPAKDATGGGYISPTPGSLTPDEFKRGLAVNRTSTGYKMTVKGMTLDDLANALMAQKETNGMPVVNQTGLTGAYDFTLTWGPERTEASDSSEAEDLPLLVAIQQQLGLNLVSAKAPAEVVVIDHIEKPVFDSTKAEAATSQAPRLVNVAMAQQAPASAQGAGAESVARAGAGPEKPLAFEVATVKPSSAQSKDFGVGMDIQPGGLVKMVNVPVSMLVEFAYDVPYQSPRMSGGPDWARTERYDIEAKAPEGAVPAGFTNQERNGRIRLMMQALLAERFKLSIQREMKDIPVYDVVVGKAGPKLKLSKAKESDCAAATTFDGMRCHALHGGQGQGLHGAAVTVADVVQFVESWSDRPMIDKTGLTGLYAIDTEGWVPMRQTAVRNPDAPGEGLSDPERQTLFGIFQGVGLRLEPAIAATQVYTIDHIERPSEN